MMDKFKPALLVALVMGGALVATGAHAQGGHGHGHHGGHFGLWFGVPAPLFYPGPYYYPRSYYPPAVAYPAPAAPPVYIEQPQAAAPAPANADPAYWYYCSDTQTYYPYVQQCASPWKQVTPQAAPAS